MLFTACDKISVEFVSSNDSLVLYTCCDASRTQLQHVNSFWHAWLWCDMGVSGVCVWMKSSCGDVDSDSIASLMRSCIRRDWIFTWVFNAPARENFFSCAATLLPNASNSSSLFLLKFEDWLNVLAEDISWLPGITFFFLHCKFCDTGFGWIRLTGFLSDWMSRQSVGVESWEFDGERDCRFPSKVSSFSVTPSSVTELTSASWNKQLFLLSYQM